MFSVTCKAGEWRNPRPGLYVLFFHFNGSGLCVQLDVVLRLISATSESLIFKALHGISKPTLCETDHDIGDTPRKDHPHALGSCET